VEAFHKFQLETIEALWAYIGKWFLLLLNLINIGMKASPPVMAFPTEHMDRSGRNVATQ
jgi:hypothetical protein